MTATLNLTATTEQVSTEEPSYPVYVARYDYDSLTDDDLHFKKGELMNIICTDESGWWWAHSKETGKEGFVPYNYVEEWLDEEK